MQQLRPFLLFMLSLIFLFLAIVIFLSSTYRKPITIPEGVVGEHINVAGIKLRIYQAGPENGQHILFLHGSIGNLEDFESVAPLLKDFRITSVDRIGHGYSAMADRKATIKNNAWFIEQLIDTLKLSDVILVGHSYGGSVSLRMALNQINSGKQRIKSMVLIAPAPYALTSTNPLEHVLSLPVIGQGLVRIIQPVFAKQMLRQGLLRALHPDENIVPDNFIESRLALWNNPGIIYTRTQQTSTVIDELTEQSQLYSSLTVPTTIMLGENEAFADIRDGCIKLANTMSNAELVLVPNAGHYLQYRAPELVANQIRLVAQ